LEEKRRRSCTRELRQEERGATYRFELIQAASSVASPAIKKESPIDHKPVYLHSIATAVPPTAYAQETIGEIMLRQSEPNSRAAKLLRRIYAHSDIDSRHSVIRDHAENREGIFLDADLHSLKSPSTGTRNTVYTSEARKLFSEASAASLELSGLRPSDITHVVTMSCTGFYAPGPDFHVVRDLGLPVETARIHLGFMGCYAALPALRTAKSIVEADPRARVLVVSVELCTLHLQPSDEIDKIIATSVFADGAGACIVEAQRGPATVPSLVLDGFATSIAPDTEGDMAWKIGDHGFDMVLSTYVPAILEADIPGALGSLFESEGWSRRDVDCWAVHPGGKAIVDRVQKALDLTDADVASSRRILRDNGNMSSATLFFVVQDLLTKCGSGKKMCAMAFGPGLTVESALLTTV